METPRERVLKAINHEQPEMTPVEVHVADDEKWLEYFGARDYLDLRDKLGSCSQGAQPVYTGPNVKLGHSIWGSEKEVGGFIGGEGYSKSRGGFPLLDTASVADVDRFAWPNPDEFDYEIVAKALQAVPPEKARLVRVRCVEEREGVPGEDLARGMGSRSYWLPLLCSLFNLFGFEGTLLRLHTEPKVIEAAVAHLEEFVLEFSRRLLDATRGLADILWYGDDFATQTGMMISPEHWRRYLKPTYRRIVELGKSYEVKIWFHSCGTFRPVLPDLVGIGIDVWETVQAHLPGNEPEVLKREYGQEIAFFGAINTQRTLPFGTPEDVRAEVRERIRVLGRGGGYICGGDHTIPPEVPIENVLAMVDEARRFRF